MTGVVFESAASALSGGHELHRKAELDTVGSDGPINIRELRQDQVAGDGTLVRPYRFTEVEARDDMRVRAWRLPPSSSGSIIAGSSTVREDGPLALLARLCHDGFPPGAARGA